MNHTTLHVLFSYALFSYGLALVPCAYYIQRDTDNPSGGLIPMPAILFLAAPVWVGVAALMFALLVPLWLTAWLLGVPEWVRRTRWYAFLYFHLYERHTAKFKERIRKTRRDSHDRAQEILAKVREEEHFWQRWDQAEKLAELPPQYTCERCRRKYTLGGIPDQPLAMCVTCSLSLSHGHPPDPTTPPPPPPPPPTPYYHCGDCKRDYNPTDAKQRAMVCVCGSWPLLRVGEDLPSSEASSGFVCVACGKSYTTAEAINQLDTCTCGSTPLFPVGDALPPDDLEN